MEDGLVELSRRRRVKSGGSYRRRGPWEWDALGGTGFFTDSWSAEGATLSRIHQMSVCSFA